MDDVTGRIAVLKDYPLRLWAEQQEYTDGLLREFRLLLLSEQADPGAGSAPAELVELADTILNQFGPLLEAVNAEREAALAAGQDRIDSRLPLDLPNLPELLEQIRVVLDRTDQFCADAKLLILPRPPHLVALQDWSREQLLAQYRGEPPTPWPGPF